MLSRALSCPTIELEASARRVVQYLYWTRDLGLFYEKEDGNLRGFSDSDWAVRHSTSGFVFKFCSAAITWSSKKQKSIALSSCEAEIMAASEASKEAVYLRRFASELGIEEDRPPTLALDNQAARDLAFNPEHHERTKHIDRRHFYIRELVENGVITVPFVRTADNLADIFTKPLAAPAFEALRDTIMNVHMGVLRLSASVD